MWNCCNCQAPNLIANSLERCPVCEHRRCPSCTIGAPPADIGSPSPLLPPSRYSYATSSNQYTSHQGLRPQNSYTPPSAPPRHASIFAGRAPPPRGSPRSSTNAPAPPPPLYASRLSYPVASSPSYGTPMHNSPSMKGWWYCCEDGHFNNPVLSPLKCGNDGHLKCSQCKVLL